MTRFIATANVIGFIGFPAIELKLSDNKPIKNELDFQGQASGARAVNAGVTLAMHTLQCGNSQLQVHYLRRLPHVLNQMN